MGTARAGAANNHAPAGRALARPPPGPQRHPVPGAHRGVPWRDLPERYGPWETVYKRFARWQTEGTWARIQASLHTQADAAGELDWNAQIDSTVVRAHQHAAGARKGGSPRSRQAAGKRSVGHGVG
jgi:transposase